MLDKKKGQILSRKFDKLVAKLLLKATSKNCFASDLRIFTRKISSFF